MSEVFRVLKPGGYFEIRDCDPVLKNLGPTGTQVFENCRILYTHFINYTYINSSTYLSCLVRP